MPTPSVPLARFAWPLPKYGYAWLDASPENVHLDEPTVLLASDNGIELTHHGVPRTVSRSYLRALVPVDVGEALSPPMGYPLEQGRAVSRELAECSPDQVSIEKFARVWGTLGTLDLTPGAGADELVRDVRFDSLASWEITIGELRAELALLDALQQRDLDTIRRTISSPHNSAQVRHGERWAFTFREDDVAGWPPQEVLAGGRHVALGRANRRVERWTTAFGEADPATGQTRLTILPLSLYGAIWTQVLQVLTGDLQYRRCQRCDHWMVYSPRSERRPKFYCSGACRTNAFRGRDPKTGELQVRDSDTAESHKRVPLLSELKGDEVTALYNRLASDDPAEG